MSLQVSTWARKGSVVLETAMTDNLKNNNDNGTDTLSQSTLKTWPGSQSSSSKEHPDEPAFAVEERMTACAGSPRAQTPLPLPSRKLVSRPAISHTCFASRDSSFWRERDLVSRSDFLPAQHLLVGVHYVLVELEWSLEPEQGWKRERSKTGLVAP